MEAQKLKAEAASPDLTEYSHAVAPNHADDAYLGIKTGIVKRFNEQRGFGFILDSENQEHFIHFTDIDSKGFRNLARAQRVLFHAFLGQHGLYAKKVRVVNG